MQDANNNSAARLEKLGQGRAAQVYLDRDAGGREIVRKIFTGELASKLVLYLLTGAPNPYKWCEAAIRSACARRRILAHLVVFWFGGKLRLPWTSGWRWNATHRAFEIASERIDGHHAPLRGPEEETGPDPVRDLVDEVMAPLQARLIEAGFDGLVWQAGRGNPVAASNFMLETARPNEDDLSWVWIDLESGVPALFAMNPLATLGYYLPRSRHHRGWLFDDVDVPKLESYVERHREDLEQALGGAAVEEIVAATAELACQQPAWKSISRHHRSIAHELSQGRISEEQAEHYLSRWLAWYTRFAATGVARMARRVPTALRRAASWLFGLGYRQAAVTTWHFCTSQRYRSRAARRLMLTRIRAWSDRGFLDAEMAHRLHAQLRHDDISAYVTDFGVHLAMKPGIKAVQWFSLPPMLALGMIDTPTAAFLLVAGGLIGRTLYTTGRLIQAFVLGQRRPWLAWGVSMLPVVGNVAYPAELVYCGTEDGGDAARFILYDSLATTGRALPIWGGQDSLVEHWFNRLGDRVMHWLAIPISGKS